ncbi:hypothetical protein LADH09A_006027 [Micromonospora sp. LAH09]|uniref:hypothetical protein n=1 Tax=Micromonospora cabrerizensis TaxID=2911213 RepID=UPI001EE78F37|nr:hypothetical protein [Micromonospora cabrerizensis]MCG5471992.1 hypothetical protein [Micromonospora cabrerizensis]
MNRPSILLTTAALALGTLVPLVGAGPASAAPVSGGSTPASARGPLATAAVTGHSHPQVLGVGGAGAYRIGASLAALTAAGRIGWTAPACGGVVHTGVTGSWAGVLILAFRDGRLVEVGTATAPPRSPAGATVGMSFAELEAIYGRRGSLIRNDAGDAEAYLVRVGSRVELFTGHPIRPGVGYFQVGPASFVERNFRQGSTC